MTFVLDAQRRGSVADMRAHFERYQAYLERHRASFPPGALSLATAPWYFDFTDHHCPHDAWLQEFILSELV